MFGKRSKMTETQKFIIAKGREAGNLKAAGPAFNKKKVLSTTSATGTGKPQPKQNVGGVRKSVGKTPESFGVKS